MDSEKRVHFQPQKVTEIGVFSRLKINEKGSFSKLENTDENTSVPVRVGRGGGGESTHFMDADPLFLGPHLARCRFDHTGDAGLRAPDVGVLDPKVI